MNKNSYKHDTDTYLVNIGSRMGSRHVSSDRQVFVPGQIGRSVYRRLVRAYAFAVEPGSAAQLSDFRYRTARGERSYAT